MFQLHAFRFVPAFLLIAAACILTAPAAALAEEAGYAGAQACAGCHEELSRSFSSTIHGKAGFWEAGFQGCESCHGPGGMHASSGDKTKITSPAAMAASEVNSMCLGCHEKTAHLRYWKGSIHQRREVACTACHSIHSSPSRDNLLKAGTEMETCTSCHVEIKTSLFQRSRHPLRDSTRSDFEANMACSDCHNPHGAVGDKLVDASSVNDKCYECHLEKKAPVLWEHSPVKENCLACHTPHGSNHPNLLVRKVPRLCQSCHFQGRHQAIAGTGEHIWSVSRGCVNCHPMIHGSNHPSAVKLNK